MNLYIWVMPKHGHSAPHTHIRSRTSDIDVSVSPIYIWRSLYLSACFKSIFRETSRRGLRGEASRGHVFMRLYTAQSIKYGSGQYTYMFCAPFMPIYGDLCHVMVSQIYVSVFLPHMPIYGDLSLDNTHICFVPLLCPYMEISDMSWWVRSMCLFFSLICPRRSVSLPPFDAHIWRSVSLSLLYAHIWRSVHENHQAWVNYVLSLVCPYMEICTQSTSLQGLCLQSDGPHAFSWKRFRGVDVAKGHHDRKAVDKALLRMHATLEHENHQAWVNYVRHANENTYGTPTRNNNCDLRSRKCDICATSPFRARSLPAHGHLTSISAIFK